MACCRANFILFSFLLLRMYFKSEMIIPLACRYLKSILLCIYAARRLIYTSRHKEGLIYIDKVQLCFGGNYSGSLLLAYSHRLQLISRKLNSGFWT